MPKSLEWDVLKALAGVIRIRIPLLVPEDTCTLFQQKEPETASCFLKHADNKVLQIKTRN